MRRVASTLAMLACVIFPATAGAATLNATPSTLASVFASAQAGDTVALASGSYGKFEGGQKSGTVTLREQDGATADLWLWLYDNTHVRFEGLTIHGGYITGSRDVAIVGGKVTDHLRVDTEAGITDAGILFDGATFTAPGGIPSGAYDGRLAIRGYDNAAPVGVQVRNSRFVGDCSDGIQVIGGAHSVEIGPGNTFEDIVQAGCGDAHTDAIQLYWTKRTHIHGNLFRRNSVAIMAPDGGNQEVIEDNVIVASDYRQAVQLGHHLGSRFSHNTVIGTNVNMDSKTTTEPSRDGILRDNVMVDGQFGLWGGGGCVGCSVSYNLFDNAAMVQGSNAIVGTPLFVGGPNGEPPSKWAEYALAVGSPGKGNASDGLDRGIRVGEATPPPPPPPTEEPPQPPPPPPPPAEEPPPPAPEPTCSDELASVKAALEAAEAALAKADDKLARISDIADLNVYSVGASVLRERLKSIRAIAAE